MMPPDKPNDSPLRCFTCYVHHFNQFVENLKANRAGAASPSDNQFNRKYGLQVMGMGQPAQFRFTSAKSLVQHHLAVHGPEELVRVLCIQCRTLFSQPGAALEHVTTTRSVSCNLCDRRKTPAFPDRPSLFRHFEKLHPEKIPLSDERATERALESNTTRWLHCSRCPGKRFGSTELLVKHVADKHNVGYDSYWNAFDIGQGRKLLTKFTHFPGDLPVFWTWTGAHFSPHIPGYLGQRPAGVGPGCNYVPVLPFERRWKCSLCGYCSPHKSRVGHHLKSVHAVMNADDRIDESRFKPDNEPDMSDVVDSSEEQPESPERPHLIIRKDTRKRYRVSQFSCLYCPKSFSMEPAVFQHYDSVHNQTHLDAIFGHSGDDFCCSYCGKIFGFVDAVRKHERMVHSDMIKDD